MPHWLSHLLALLLGLFAAVGPAVAASSIDPTQPVQGAPYNAAPIRQNFGAAANDINALQSLNAGPSAPAAPGAGTLWLNTATSTWTLNLYAPPTRSWVPVARVDSTTGLWEPPVGGGNLPTLTSAATTDLGSVPQAALYVSGSQSIASFGSSAPAGQVKFITFTGAPTLLYNATFMVLPGGVNLSLSGGQSLIAVSLGGGAWQVGFSGVTACGLFSATASGCVPASGGGAVNFLRADATWSPILCATLTNSGTACPANTGTSGHTLPFLNGVNTWGGNQTIGAPAIDLSPFGPVALTVATQDTGSGSNVLLGQGILGFHYNNGTTGLPVGSIGYGYLAAAGDQVFALYGLAENHVATGTVLGAELTGRNYCGGPADTSLPPNEAIGTTKCVVQGLQITSGGTNNSSVGLQIGGEGGVAPFWNTAAYIYQFAQYGLYIDAQASGSQNPLVVGSNGSGPNIHLFTSAEPTPTNSLVDYQNHAGAFPWYVRYNGTQHVGGDFDVSGTSTFHGVVGAVATQAGTACTLNSSCTSQATDCGTVILFTANSAVTVTVPATLPVGCNIALSQVGTGQVSVSAGAGATVYSSHSYTKTSGQHAVIGLSVETNAGGSAANVNLLGDGST